MRRDAKALKRLIRAQQVIADKARLVHGQAQASLERNSQDLAALDAHADAADAQSLALLDLYVERARALAAEHERLADAVNKTRQTLIQRSAAIEPLNRRHRHAQSAEERAAHEMQMGEMIDRQAAEAQASRKPRK